MASFKSTTPCGICGKSYVNVALHHTKSHAVFTIEVEENVGKIMKDGVCLTTLCMGVGSSSNDKGQYTESETCLDDDYKAMDDGKTYRFMEYEDGTTELWLTTLARGGAGTYWGGKNSQMITNKIASTLKKTTPKPIVPKPIVIEETLDDEPPTLDALIAYVKAMPPKEYAVANASYQAVNLEQCVMASLSPEPQNVKMLLKAVQSKIATATKSDINSILYKNIKTLKRTMVEGVSAPMWNI